MWLCFFLPWCSLLPHPFWGNLDPDLEAPPLDPKCVADVSDWRTHTIAYLRGRPGEWTVCVFCLNLGLCPLIKTQEASLRVEGFRCGALRVTSASSTNKYLLDVHCSAEAIQGWPASAFESSSWYSGRQMSQWEIWVHCKRKEKSRRNCWKEELMSIGRIRRNQKRLWKGWPLRTEGHMSFICPFPICPRHFFKASGLKLFACHLASAIDIVGQLTF